MTPLNSGITLALITTTIIV